jgi:hypothetical protein
MAGFAHLGQVPEADDAGRVWVSQFRKAVASAATVQNAGIDYSYFAGSPPANFYASAPLVSAYVESSRGIYVPTVGAGQKQFLNNVKVMSAASGATSVANGRQLLLLSDYLMYYPFVDTDAIGEEQLMENTVTLPRYTSGQVIAVAQSASSAIGTFTMNYTNQDGVAGQISQTNLTFVVAGGGQVVNARGTGASYNSFVNLAVGDTGVRSIESVTFTAAGGGLMALVIVHPLMLMFFNQESRVTTTGNIESYGACDEFQSVIHKAGMPEIKDGAVLNFFASGFAGSLASSILVGTLETIWN